MIAYAFTQQPLLYWLNIRERTPAYRGGGFLLQREQHH